MLTSIYFAVINIFTLAIGFKPDSWQKTLPALVIGMIGIFLVIGIIILATYGLNKFFSRKKNDSEE